MAKGNSSFRQLGKIDGRKYYRIKGSDKIISQSINEGMSNRVKNDAAYANTRLNNAEFGGAGSTAGAITRALSQKWRYLLVPFATGKLAADVRRIMSQDTTGAWGQRGCTGTAWQATLAEKVSQYSKNAVSDYTGLILSCNFSDENGIEMYFEANSLQNEVVKAKGATGVRFIAISGAVKCSKFDTTAKKYTNAECDMSNFVSLDIDFGSTDDDSALNDKYKQTAQQSDMLLGGIVVLMPYKEVNGEKYIMQELCSFKMLAATVA